MMNLRIFGVETILLIKINVKKEVNSILKQGEFCNTACCRKEAKSDICDLSFCLGHWEKSKLNPKYIEENRQ